MTEKITQDNRVDVIIPAYNQGSLLRKSIESVLAQTYKKFKITVVDDCSDQNIDLIVRSYPQVSLLRTEKNSGPSAARNLGIKSTNSEFVSFLDADDFMHEKKLEKSIYELDKDSKIGLTCGNYRVIYNKRKLLKPFYSRSIDINYKMLLRQNFVASGSTTVRRAVLEDVGLFDESLWISEDYDLWLRISEKYKIKYIHEVLYYYSVEPAAGSLTNQQNSASVGRKNNDLIRARSIKRVKNNR